MTITTDPFAGIRPELLTVKVRAALDQSIRSRRFASDAHDAVRAAVIAVDEATTANDASAAITAEEHLAAARRVAARPAALYHENAIALTAVLRQAWRTYLDAVKRRPMHADAREFHDRLRGQAEMFRQTLDKFAQDPAGSEIDPLDALRQASALLDSVDTYLNDYGDSPSGTLNAPLSQPVAVHWPPRQAV